MRRMLALLPPALIGAGLLLLVFPFVSVWRLSGEVLDELPATLASTEQVDRNRLALFDSDFVLATSTFDDTSVADLRAALSSAGYEPSSRGGERWLGRACCGDYDAVLIRLEETSNGGATAVLTAADADLQATWPVLAVIGLALGAAGAGLGRALRGSRDPQPDDSELAPGDPAALQRL